MRTTVWSCGGGRQSAAIAALIVQGRLPKPDVAVMVDTEREKSATFRYADAVLIPELAKVGVDLVVVKKSQFAKYDLHSGNGDLLLPVFTDQKGQLSKMPTFCSGEWKSRVVDRYLRSLGVKECDLWLGMSIDEVWRIKISSQKWKRKVYPLVGYAQDDRFGMHPAMSVADCVGLVTITMGWPPAPSSACYMCPNMPHLGWLQMRESDPEDFEKAAALEDELRESDPHIFFHKSGKPLREVDWSVEPSIFGDAEDGCENGVCFV